MLSISSTAKLDMEDLRKRQIEKEKRKMEVYDCVLKKCHAQILRSNESNTDNTFFRVPKFQLGKPPISNFKACLAYIIYNLQDNGLSVHYFFPDTLWISWGTQNKQASLPPTVDQVQFLGEQPLRHEDKIDRVQSAKHKQTKEDKLMQINKAVCREIPKEHTAKRTVYDEGAFQSLQYLADRIKKK